MLCAELARAGLDSEQALSLSVPLGMCRSAENECRLSGLFHWKFRATRGTNDPARKSENSESVC